MAAIDASDLESLKVAVFCVFVVLGVFILIFCFGSVKMGWVLCCVLCKYMLYVLLGGCLFFFEKITSTWVNDPI